MDAVTVAIVAAADPVDPLISLLNTLVSTVEKIGGTYLLPAAGAICVVVIIYGGIQYITGGDKGAETGKKTIIAAIIGLIIVSLAYAIIREVANLI